MFSYIVVTDNGPVMYRRKVVDGLYEAIQEAGQRLEKLNQNGRIIVYQGIDDEAVRIYTADYKVGE
jgi:hypothetical protein